MPAPHAVRVPDTARTTSPLVPAVVWNGTIFVSGCVPVDRDGKLVGDDIETQTRQVLANVKTVLAAAGGSLAGVLKTTVYLTEQADFAAMNRVYAEVFGAWLPARTTIVVAALARTGFKVEIEAIAAEDAAG
jgi:2-iminobutanoate/2-iminopropanoate deaminase